MKDKDSKIIWENLISENVYEDSCIHIDRNSFSKSSGRQLFVDDDVTEALRSGQYEHVISALGVAVFEGESDMFILPVELAKKILNRE